ncbi:interleukin 2 receptor subunit beta [Phyllostomus discolor]|uniref:Interleukin-2 receptor subunit beta n=1 Tax=Phyllostomus discolor TaxID=89673 RepID=A0A7E6D857_9CHIR|nr:interleukin-2 receptor subunit beta [Phyllostomus discolor]KAF6119144.1 interleukin 2 receptor subunit beta [Phyllostomus discolor]
MAAPALCWRLSLLLFLLPLPIPGASTAVQDTPELTCFYNSRANISCIWSPGRGLPDPSCRLHAKPQQRPWNRSCELLPAGPASWACNLILDESPESQMLTAADVVNMSVMCRDRERWQLAMTQKFQPFENLRLMAPNSLRVTHLETRSCNVTWAINQSSHYVERYLEFEARLRLASLSWEGVPLLTIGQNQRWIYLETLDPGTQYVLQVRVRAQRGSNSTWSPWSQPLAFRTVPESPSLGHIIVGLSGAFGFIIIVYLLVNCRYLRLWLKKALKCHIPDPSEFFSQLSSEHGGDFQKWLSSPFPSSSFSPGGPAPEISPLEVLDREAKATQLLLLQQDKARSSSLETSGHSLTSCFTNQGYFFFHLPDALEIESCQVYFTYDPCVEEPDDQGGPGAPEGPPLSPLPPLPGEDDAYCTFPPRGDLLLFSPTLVGGPGPPDTALGATDEERLPPSLPEGVPKDWGPPSLEPPTPAAPDLVDFQSPLENALGEAGEGGSGPGPGPGVGAGFPWASPPGQCQVRAPTFCLPLNTDAYLSLQELQDQDPAHLV